MSTQLASITRSQNKCRCSPATGWRTSESSRTFRLRVAALRCWAESKSCASKSLRANGRQNHTSPAQRTEVAQKGALSSPNSVIFDSPEQTPSPLLLMPQRPAQQQSVSEPSPSIISASIQFANHSFRPPSFLDNRLRFSSRFAKVYDVEKVLLTTSTILTVMELAEDGTEGGVAPCSSAATTAAVAVCLLAHHLPLWIYIV